MTHEMKLNPEPFEQIQAGRKTIELRLNDEKRQKVGVGDTIIFSDTEDMKRKLATRVLARHHYTSFRELFAVIPLDICGFDKDIGIDAAVDEMREYYSEEYEQKYGALGIELELVEESCTYM